MLNEEFSGIVERMGLVFEADGLPRSAGRILGLLFISPEPRSLDELAEALQLSKGSASSSTRLLERLGPIERVTRPGDRKDYYRVADDVDSQLLNLWITHLDQTRNLLAAALVERRADSVVRERLESSCSFFSDMTQQLRAAGERWRNRIGSNHESPPLDATGTEGDK
jgi:DNA-binding transcriptional regulator GbsR (MarR family)